jgi:hypothetical protein
LHDLDSSETAQPIYIESRDLECAWAVLYDLSVIAVALYWKGTTSVLGYSSTQVFQ